MFFLYVMIRRHPVTTRHITCLPYTTPCRSSGSGARCARGRSSAIKGSGEESAAGDTISLANGEWRDFQIVFTGTGTAAKPIALTAQTKGKVLITGQSNLRIGGQHLLV